MYHAICDELKLAPFCFGLWIQQAKKGEGEKHQIEAVTEEVLRYPMPFLAPCPDQ